ncbi:MULTISPECIES: DUF6479 family protein [unclassified Streptomyces]|uniref:DUF6479 family protein n=1 Tax=unclassified Streptomyces TaxID=2593676 RepID=UPI0022588E24|nr:MULTISPECIES: DUF6479 family protein [unclassified Streptomyces]MCX4524162.1 DUF6479 family protein [Streptomyces sp. NBC_01551]MCX4545319.1 DUF6479 family protein [Streptomyces sp. NBC_01565]
MNLATVLSAEATPSLLLILVGVVIAALLVAAFWWGSRRAARRRSPVGATPQPRSGSWQTPEEAPDQGRPGS